MNFISNYFAKKRAAKLQIEMERLEEEQRLQEERRLQEHNRRNEEMIKHIAFLVYCCEQAKKAQRQFNEGVIERDQLDDRQQILFNICDEHYQHPGILRKLIAEIAYNEPEMKVRYQSKTKEKHFFS